MVLDWKGQRMEKKFLFDEFVHTASNDVDRMQVDSEATKATEIAKIIVAKTEKGLKEGKDSESLKETCVEDFKKITELYDQNLDIEKVCTHIENMAETDEAQKVIQEAFKPIKEAYLQKEKQFGEALNTVQDEVVKLGNNEQVKKQMGSANAEMLDGIAQKMNERLKGIEKPRHRAEILTKGIAEMQQFVENAEKQAGKGKFGKVMNVLKSAFKVIKTGGDKTAKLELAAATFAMNNKNAEKIKAYSKGQISTRLTASTQSINKAQEGRGGR